jgi:hypothetical protein
MAGRTFALGDDADDERRTAAAGEPSERSDHRLGGSLGIGSEIASITQKAL